MAMYVYICAYVILSVALLKVMDSILGNLPKKNGSDDI